MGGSSSDYSRGFELPDGHDLESPGGAHDHHEDDYGIGGAMLPMFLNDLRNNNDQDLVEVTLELDNDSIVVCSVAPTATTSKPTVHHEASTPDGGILRRSLSNTSRTLRRKFSWLRSTSSKASSETEELIISARDARRLKAKLQRTRSSAQRALSGLRFISKTTGANDADEMWRRVESRFNSLAKDGLLSRDDFGECIGKIIFYFHTILSAWFLRKILSVAYHVMGRNDGLERVRGRDI